MIKVLYAYVIASNKIVSCIFLASMDSKIACIMSDPVSSVTYSKVRMGRGSGKLKKTIIMSNCAYVTELPIEIMISSAFFVVCSTFLPLSDITGWSSTD